MKNIPVLAALVFVLAACSKNPSGPKTPPKAVSGFDVFARNAGDSIAWIANASADAVTAYRIYAGTTATGLTLLTETKATNLVRTGLVNGTTYYYQISAVNAAGEGPRSEVVASTPIPPFSGEINLSVPQALPGALRVLPMRYYSNTPATPYFGNPFIFSDTFKIVIQARVMPGFDSVFADKIQNTGFRIPPGTTILQNYDLPRLLPNNTVNQFVREVPRIDYWSDGVDGQFMYTYFGAFDTIPFAVELGGAGLNGKSPADIIKNVHFVHYGTTGGSVQGRAYYNRVLALDDFTVRTAAVPLDKTKPHIYALAGKWYIIVPIASKPNNSPTGTTAGNANYCIRLMLKDGSRIERTVVDVAL